MLMDEVIKKEELDKNKIYLTEDYLSFVLLNNGEITYVDDSEKTKMDRYNPGTYWFKLLSLLVRNPGTYITASMIAEIVYEREKHYDYEMQVDALFREIRKKPFFRYVKERGFKLSKKRNESSYAAFLPRQRGVDVCGDELPRILTNIRFVAVPKSELIYREKEIKRIKDELSNGERAINIAGSGGIGKTSLAKILFEDIRDNYDSIGWMEYNGNLKESILRSCPLFSKEKNDEKRWSAITALIRNTQKKILLFVDNVSFDSKRNQDPRTDGYLREVTGWLNITIVLTSRFVLTGYHSIILDTIGDEENPEPCVDLFCLYNHNADKIRQGDTIRKIVALCRYHTFAIELVAKACLYDSVEEHYHRLKAVGFLFPKISFATAHGEYTNEDADEQIRKLFDLDTRTQKEVYALNVFSLLPEMETLSSEEMESWFEVWLNDIKNLLEEAWIRYENNAFYIHPLVKEATLLRYDEQVIADAVKTFAGRIGLDSYYMDYDSHSETARKLWIAHDVLIHSDNDRSETYNSCIQTGDLARTIGIREVALSMYQKALSVFERNVTIQRADPVGYWRATYYYGYLLSYTRTGLIDAERYIRQALYLLDDMEESEEMLWYRAKALDHLGYILSDKIWEESDSEAQKCFHESLRNLKVLSMGNPQNERYKHMMAWVEDNWGYYLSSMSEEDSGQAEEHLKNALNLRIMLAYSNPSAEVAWSCNTLGIHYLVHKQHFMEAEALFVRAIKNYEVLNQELSGVHDASVASSHSNYASLLIIMGDSARHQEAANHLSVAMTLYQQEIGDFEYEYAQTLNNLGCIYEIRNDRETAIDFYREALKTYHDHEFDDDADVIRTNLRGASFLQLKESGSPDDYIGRQRFLFLQCGSRRRLVNVEIGTDE